MYNLVYVDAVDAETKRVISYTRELIKAYRTVGDELRYNMASTFYMDAFGFVNFRVETACSCLLLVENKLVADALGLSRSLFEHYLLFILMCRGRKLIKLEDLSSSGLTAAQFKAKLRERQDEVAQARAAGRAVPLSVEQYQHTKQIMYVFEGVRDSEDPSYLIPIHYFSFQRFRPEVMRLEDEHYFQYYERSQETKKAVKGFKAEAASQYRYYLSYDALLQNLKLNGVVTSGDIARIEAHYTFLGKTLHPTHHAAQDLHEVSNVHATRPAVGDDQTYAPEARLLTALYVCYIVHGLFEEVARLLEEAPETYVKDPGTATLRKEMAHLSAVFPYFWFVFNEPPLYDKFNWCIYHATDDELKEWGHYSKAPGERITFHQHIFSHFKSGLMEWNNARVGRYPSPIAR
ncbi:hypothetical protein KDK95_05565 [Actinospica sp. MGRD01-02]|uniref:Uncharacterized protein n=1 Tax=Actinospica acidithermotolerans TaxID=2828514 RepID=A0A941E798_9ACTN|nr:hypothetical protein [Actinospica acidithermotolerans]MBR7825767.1 hypothetical protein [Actinospica acidithermotolerans]